eukprot:7380945-Prymnesium_polylepis.1
MLELRVISTRLRRPRRPAQGCSSQPQRLCRPSSLGRARRVSMDARAVRRSLSSLGVNVNVGEAFNLMQ